MANELIFDDGGKARPKPAHETAEPQMDNKPLTAAQIQAKPDPATLARMQQTVGNAAVQRFLAQRSAAGPAELDETTAASINSQRGSGEGLHEGVADKAGAVMGQDFSNVKVHTDNSADQLSRQLNAKAFTTGSDIFFRSGAYNPGSSDGQQLISHELTHVVQQGASVPSVQGKMTVNEPGDAYEQEADAVANQVMSMPDDVVTQRQEEEELMAKREDVQRQEEEELMGKWEGVQRQEEEELMGKWEGVQRQEEEELAMKPEDVQRQEEEELALKPEGIQRQEELDEEAI
jgi:hypothetical protein